MCITKRQCATKKSFKSCTQQIIENTGTFWKENKIFNTIKRFRRINTYISNSLVTVWRSKILNVKYYHKRGIFSFISLVLFTLKGSLTPLVLQKEIRNNPCYNKSALFQTLHILICIQWISNFVLLSKQSTYSFIEEKIFEYPLTRHMS